MASDRSSRARRGFTLIEIMCAVTILIIIIAATGRIYASVTKAYNDTIKQSERDANARAVMDYIAREVGSAYFDNPNTSTGALVSMRYKSNTTKGNFGLEGGDELWFVCNRNDPDSDNPREARQVVYYMRNAAGLSNAPPNAAYRFNLHRGYYNASPSNASSYNVYYGGANGLNWSGTAASPAGKPTDNRPIVENVRTFEVFAYSDELGTRKLDWSSTDPDPLYAMDLYLETMSEADAIKAAQLAATLGPDNARTVEFVESVVRRHYQRIYFPEKMAYYDGPL